MENVLLVSEESSKYSFPRHMLGQWISGRRPLKRRSSRTEGGGSGKWKLGQVRVTKHGIYTLLFQRKGQAHCMWANVSICIQRTQRMWDPAMVRNPMQDSSLPAIQCPWWGVYVLRCVLSWRDVWLTHFASWGKALPGYFKLRVFFSLLFAPVMAKNQLQFCDHWSNGLILLWCPQAVTRMATFCFLPSFPTRGCIYISWFIAFWWDTRSSWFIPVACNLY